MHCVELIQKSLFQNWTEYLTYIKVKVQTRHFLYHKSYCTNWNLISKHSCTGIVLLVERKSHGKKQDLPPSSIFHFIKRISPLNCNLYFYTRIHTNTERLSSLKCSIPVMFGNSGWGSFFCTYSTCRFHIWGIGWMCGSIRSSEPCFSCHVIKVNVTLKMVSNISQSRIKFIVGFPSYPRVLGKSKVGISCTSTGSFS